MQNKKQKKRVSVTVLRNKPILLHAKKSTELKQKNERFMYLFIFILLFSKLPCTIVTVNGAGKTLDYSFWDEKCNIVLVFCCYFTKAIAS